MVEKKDIKLGDVLYYIDKGDVKWKVNFGIVNDMYPNVVVLDLYELYDTRLINDIPIKDFVTPTRWQKLPKNWTYNTKLYNLTWGKYPMGCLAGYCLDLPESILQAIEDQTLVKVTENDHASIVSEIDSTKGWRLIREYKNEYHPSYVSLTSHDVYKTYEEVEKVIKDHEVELKRQTMLSDYDWSLEQIDHTLKFWACLYGVSEEKTTAYKEWLLNLEKLEDVEVRIWDKNIQWKYWKNKRWMDIMI